MDAIRFPRLSGIALDGSPFEAPRDLAGARTVALVAFALAQRASLDTWVPYLDALVRSRPDVRARLLIPIAAPKLLRGGILTAMKAAVTAPELRASTIPLFVDDVAAVARALGIADASELQLLLVEADGDIRWRAAGAYTQSAGAQLDAALGRSAEGVPSPRRSEDA